MGMLNTMQVLDACESAAKRTGLHAFWLRWYASNRIDARWSIERSAIEALIYVGLECEAKQIDREVGRS